VKRLNAGAELIDLAKKIWRIGKCGIATWVRRNRTRFWISGGIILWQAIERLGSDTVLRPIPSKRAEVTVKRTVFLGDHEDVIDTLQAGGKGCRPRAAIDRTRAGCAVSRTPDPPAETEAAVSWRGCEHNIGMAGKICGTCRRAVDTAGSTGYGAATRAINR